MKEFNEADLTNAVIERISKAENARERFLLTSLVKHAHSFIRETKPSEAEWFSAIKFLLDSAKISDHARNEFILFSDILGVSMLVDSINNRKVNGGTESSVLGPFYQENAPDLENESSFIQTDDNGEKVYISGKVLDSLGNPISGATLDIWQTASNGLYHMQDNDQDQHNLCGKLTTDVNGNYSFTTIKPVSYAIPTDGPVGSFLNIYGSHPFRPAHIHFIISADGYQSVTTELYSSDDKYLESDAVYGVKNSLIIEYIKDSKNPKSWTLNYDFSLELS